MKLCVDADLVKTEILQEMINIIRNNIPELAHIRTERYSKQLGVDEIDAEVLSAEIEVAELFEKVATEIIISKPKINRAAVPKNIAKFVHKKVVLVDSVDNALEYAKLRAGKNGLVVLTGSIYTVGEAFSLLKKKVFQ